MHYGISRGIDAYLGENERSIDKWAFLACQSLYALEAISVRIKPQSQLFYLRSNQNATWILQQVLSLRLSTTNWQQSQRNELNPLVAAFRT